MTYMVCTAPFFRKNKNQATKANRATWSTEKTSISLGSGVSLIHQAGPGMVLAGKVTTAEPIQLLTQ